MNQEIKVMVNGEKRKIEVKPTDILLDVLRNKLGLKSPKCGCGRGDCGTCTVLINGKSVKSCLVLGIEVDGQEVTTLEGLMDNGLLRVQEKMLEGNSFQCGFCAPGFIVMSHELLEENPGPTKEEIKEAMAGNLCRCTGYTPILEAIEKTCGCKE
ncbi:MAG: (2Fe-2S)-binding protein [Bdellovibrionales bacterium RIFOXYB1_FULL_37_110]|nr:MAG: (2Fe-2S)-binding protein [Bdellovibrionales bacterium RIFOXYC1_FULL_37_79]OFZ59049.1 MAG: (2Fe-2S)-binding protein [Bdellovibrionales bacterium RIFOXYB1_FULL_37_110]OFZ65154.1 MAG: (2Fe-2S)-binding protein [Bdellovibrionales bacterium RIFOXYD1_FULL_36_51]